jgi:calpain
MNLDDFYQNFNSIQFCHLTPDSLSEEILKKKHNKYISWKMVSYHGEWIVNCSAGGSGNSNNNIYWTNPQFLIKLEDVDKDDNEEMATVIVGQFAYSLFYK